MDLDYSHFNLALIVQGLIVVIIIGMFYIVWMTTQAYGGIIGKSLRFLAFGILFISIAVIEKMLVNFEVLKFTSSLSLVQDIFNLMGLMLLAWGFSRLAAAGRV